MHYYHCVSLLSIQFAFQSLGLALDTDSSTFTMGRAHYSQLIDSGLKLLSIPYVMYQLKLCYETLQADV